MKGGDCELLRCRFESDATHINKVARFNVLLADSHKNISYRNVQIRESFISFIMQKLLIRKTNLYGGIRLEADDARLWSW